MINYQYFKYFIKAALPALIGEDAADKVIGRPVAAVMWLVREQGSLATSSVWEDLEGASYAPSIRTFSLMMGRRRHMNKRGEK